jgi:hypothetical protein
MTIGKRCPRFQEYQRLYGRSTNLQKALCDFYSVVVRCCEQAVVTIRRTGEWTTTYIGYAVRA